VHVFLFDLDGTLIDHFGAIHRSYAHTLQEMGLPAPTPLQVRNAIGGGIENSLARFLPKERLAEGMGIYRAYWDRTMLDDVKLLPGARELLDGLHAKGCDLGVITNKLGSSSRQICDHLGITPLMKAIAGAKDTEWLKPAPEFTRHVLDLMGSPDPKDCLLVGDSPWDIQAAHVGGMPAWCVTTGTHAATELQEAKADRIFPDLFELAKAVEREVGLR
jgi:HAD superfamily hydrolase (TIGR01509 family)